MAKVEVDCTLKSFDFIFDFLAVSLKCELKNNKCGVFSGIEYY